MLFLAQSAGAVQLVLQALVTLSQLYGSQAVIGPGMHFSAAVQVEAAFTLPLFPSQLAGAQTVPFG